MPTILASDPGTNNFSTAALSVDFKKAKFTYKLRRVTMIQNRIKDLTTKTLRKEVDKFGREYYGLVAAYKPQHIIAERYMNRGRQGGTTGEAVSLMLGVMSRTPHCKDILLVTAAQWKNAFNRNWDLEELYELSPFVAHAVDAICMGLYRGCQVVGTKPFEFLNNKAAPKLLLKQMGELHATIVSGK